MPTDNPFREYNFKGIRGNYKDITGQQIYSGQIVVAYLDGNPVTTSEVFFKPLEGFILNNEPITNYHVSIEQDVPWLAKFVGPCLFTFWSWTGIRFDFLR